MTVRIFIGSSPLEQDLEAEIALEHSIRSRASAPVEIEWMRQSRDRVSFWYVGAPGGWNTSGWATPFSGFRWAIPERCGFEGKAIYMDVDMLCVGDVASLFDMEFLPGAQLMCKAPGSERFCVVLFDCAACRGTIWPVDKLRAGAGAHRAMRRHYANHARVVHGFPRGHNWNCCDGEDYADALDPEIKLHHFTRIPTQPHLPMARRRLALKGATHWFGGKLEEHQRQDIIALWREEYEAAVAALWAAE